jgi:hypothetical protein
MIKKIIAVQQTKLNQDATYLDILQ